MSNNTVNKNTAEIEYAERNSGNPRKIKKIDILIFILCICLAFIFWCYALYVDDPIIEKNITVNFVLEGGESNEFLMPATKKIVVYGEKSVLDNMTTVTVKVKRSDFTEYNTDTLITIEFPNHIRSKTEQVILQLNLIPN
ncbi:MAG: hypothetical protein ACI3XL_05445 [Eubacteriales bacterium]